MNESAYISISPEARALIPRLKGDASAGVAICRTIDRENELTVGHIQRDYLSQRGPTTLGVITNRLRSSIRPSRAYPDGQTVRSGIGSNVVYAGSHEFGFDGEVPVKEYTRRNQTFGDKYSAAGGAEILNYAQALRWGLLEKSQVTEAARKSGKYKFARKGQGAKQTAVGGDVVVKAHTMHQKIKARHYVFNGIKDRLPNYGSAVSTAIMRAFKGPVLFLISAFSISNF